MPALNLITTNTPSATQIPQFFAVISAIVLVFLLFIALLMFERASEPLTVANEERVPLLTAEQSGIECSDRTVPDDEPTVVQRGVDPRKMTLEEIDSELRELYCELEMQPPVDERGSESARPDRDGWELIPVWVRVY
ncbi:hypothetical protein CC80DRAFT_589871 [Byssothecium circinans]|uniref:Uncharacterized protein n=1 Tax=Byssothecium circinans TaxID=147558 RepID=A0A6A5UB22_9PLEO|nr:hypothetical protein CC80DRAFT_589871 [Byssothecium circinans]